MKKATIIVGAIAILTALFVLAASRRDREQAVDPKAAATAIPATGTQSETHHGFLYGRITTNNGGATYEGRLRWGGDEEAFWGDYFNGFKDENRWAANVPPERLTEQSRLEIFGIKIAERERRIELGRPFMARFGDIASIEALDRDIRVALKSGTVFDLDRFSADDLADGLRVWDTRLGVVDLDEWGIRFIEFFPTPQPGAVPGRLHGTVVTPQGDFTGFIQWNRTKGVATDTLDGHTADGGLVNFPFDTIRSIARNSDDSALVTFVDGREVPLSNTPEVGPDHQGIYVDDPRYGRVLISWDAFERVAFSPGGTGPAFDDFPPGRPLTGSVITRTGRRLAGRLVYDLDESETTETLDAPFEGVNYNIPFGLIASILLGEGTAQHATVVLHSGEELALERTGDLGEGLAGVLVFIDEREPEYVPWNDVGQVDFDRPPAMYPALGGF